MTVARPATAPPGPAPVAWIEKRHSHGVTQFVARDLRYLSLCLRMANGEGKS